MSKKNLFILVLVVSVVGFVSCDLTTSYGDEYSFYLTEVSTSGSVGGLSVDYIELYNSTDEDIDLTGYYFGDSEDITECYVVESSLRVNEWSSVTSEWTSADDTDTEATIIPSNSYLIVLFSNDFAISDAVSKTDLVTWIDKESETQTVEDEFADIIYLTVPAGLKDSKAEGVYIYDSEGNQATNAFTYTANEQEDNKVFLYMDSAWTQGTASPGSSNE
jgi:hypothetical protein